MSWMVRGKIKTKNQNVYQVLVMDPDGLHVPRPPVTESDPVISEKETAQRIADDLNRPDALMIWSPEKVPNDLELDD